ncbi:hypothetical protein K1719_025998 [Acacia pycnantha]|nr:hypothetical protein K1719_025998 [Acacia pycnantha]
MASSPSSSPLGTLQQQKTIALLLYIATFLSFIPSSTGCPYTSIFSFGDSLADTGNLFFISQPPHLHHCCRPPYGETYFGHPTGRCSDGRLIIDFIAESLNIPLVKPYLGVTNGQISNWTKEEGVNFAVAGATALDLSFFEERGIYGVISTNDSLSVQLDLIDLGAQTLVVPGNFPIGCSAFYLTMYESKHKNDYDEAGCLVWLNKFAEYYNQRLQSELNQLQELHPRANIIYADYYNAALPLYQSPTKFGFMGLKACCGGGAAYNYNASNACGGEGVNGCDDPSNYEFQMQYGSIGWSVGATLGYAEAANSKRVIACIGDGSFQVTAQDISTMIRCGQKSIIFLINNGGYTTEVKIHDGPYNVIKNWDYTGAHRRGPDRSDC